MLKNSLEQLNGPQRQAAMIADEHVRIIAGAGSGKTRVLKVRIAYLIEEIGILPWRIMAITFTNKAANEMKERLRAMIGPTADDVRISTIHSLCVRMLREDGMTIGYPSTFTILDPDDQHAIIRRIEAERSISKKDFSPASVTSYISSCKSADVPVEKALAQAASKQKVYAELYEQYEKVRREMKAMDFDDLLREADRMLKTEPQVREKWQKRLDYIHVDEFQDVDPVQYSIVRQLCGPDTKVCVVGDPDQTIYTWRGASVDLILRFDKDFVPCQTIILNENYRSTRSILDASNKLIANNMDRIKKDLFTSSKEDDPIVFHESLEDSEESVFVARQIVDLHKQGIPYSDMALLYRSNFLSRTFEKTFRTVGLPYRIYGGIRFYERKEIKDILSYLRLCTEPDENDPDRLALNLAVTRVLNVPKRSIGEKTIEKIRIQAAQEQINMYEVLSHPENIAKSTATKLLRFYDMIEDLKNIRAQSGLLAMFDALLEESGYEKMLTESDEQERLDNILELRSDIADSLKDAPDMTLEQYLQDIALFTDRSEDGTEQSGVTMMTVHASKGLEFPVVIVTDLNEGIFPNGRAINESGRRGLEEERRLLYVAMTRAKKKLILTWSSGYSYMLDCYKTPSRFLDEIPQEEEEEASDAPQESKDRKRSKGAKVKYRKGDLVEHKVFGQGIIIDIDHNTAMIAFGHKTGVKKIDLDHPAIQKA